MGYCMCIGSQRVGLDVKASPLAMWDCLCIKCQAQGLDPGQSLQFCLVLHWCEGVHPAAFALLAITIVYPGVPITCSDFAVCTVISIGMIAWGLFRLLCGTWSRGCSCRWKPFMPHKAGS